jgi:hypothetical protein
MHRHRGIYCMDVMGKIGFLHPIFSSRTRWIIPHHAEEEWCAAVQYAAADLFHPS